jgi:hypothetical protein
VTNFPENADDTSIRKLFAQVHGSIGLTSGTVLTHFVVWAYFRRSVAKQEV